VRGKRNRQAARYRMFLDRRFGIGNLEGVILKKKQPQLSILQLYLADRRVPRSKKSKKFFSFKTIRRLPFLNDRTLKLNKNPNEIPESLK
jgi:hypothetical protein